MVNVLHNDEVIGKWSSMVSTTIFFRVAKNVTSERLTALLLHDHQMMGSLVVVEWNMAGSLCCFLQLGNEWAMWFKFPQSVKSSLLFFCAGEVKV